MPDEDAIGIRTLPDRLEESEAIAMSFEDLISEKLLCEQWGRGNPIEIDPLTMARERYSTPPDTLLSHQTTIKKERDSTSEW